MPSGQSVRMYNLAKKKQEQRKKSKDPGTRKGSTTTALKLMEKIGAETKRKSQPNIKFVTRGKVRVPIRNKKK
jgi:hypothetical protein